MRTWLVLLLFGTLAVATAFGWQALASDPGYVLIALRGVRIETSLVFAVLAVLGAALILALLWRLVRWPLRSWARRTRRRSRERIARGLIALYEGRYARAIRELEKATHYAELRAPAELVMARAALALGDVACVNAALDAAAEQADAATLALRARLLREQDQAEAAFRLLQPGADAGTLPPLAWVDYAETALAVGNPEAARAALVPLARARALTPERYAALEVRVLGAALLAQRDADSLDALWASLSRAQRRLPVTLAAYARRGAALGRPLPGISEIERALRHEWQPDLVRLWGELGEAEANLRLRSAEGWLKAHAEDPVLLTTLGRLCVTLGLWGKAQEYLVRALAYAPDAAVWEALGDAARGAGDPARAAQCYANALAALRGADVTAPDLPAPTTPEVTLVADERDEHGMPRLAAPR